MYDKVLITGATGFIGSHLAKDLVDKGQTIRCLVRSSSSKIAVGYLQRLGAELVYGDLLDIPSLKKAVHGINAVYHLGGGGRVGMPKQMQYKINVEGTKNLLETCLEQGHIEKFVHQSTCAVMGDIRGNGPADETYPYNPNNIAYSKAKTETEKLALLYKDRIPLVVVRFPGVYGSPLMKEERSKIDGVTPFLMIISSIKDKQWRYIGDGKNLVRLVHTDDAVHGFELAAENGKLGEAYIIGDNKAVSMEEMVETIARILNVDAPKGHIPVSVAQLFAVLYELRARLLGGVPTISREMVTGFITNMDISISKAKRELGYQPRITLEEGMKETISWYKENGYLN